MKTLNNRTTQYDINDIFLNRWSSRAMSGESMSKNELMTLFDAARWAPSSGNSQPWRFLYATRDSEHFDTYLALLAEGNREWCVHASALIVVVGLNDRAPGKPLTTRSLDVGSAWQSFALQGSTMDLVIHGMAGFDYDVAKKELYIPDAYTVEMMIAVGKSGDKKNLSEKLQDRDTPSDRLPLDDIVYEGLFS